MAGQTREKGKPWLIFAGFTGPSGAIPMRGCEARRFTLCKKNQWVKEMRIVQELPGIERDRPVHCIGNGDLCDLFDITPAMLTQLVQRGVVVRLGRNSYDLEQSTRNYVKHLRGVASGRGAGESALTLTGERARLARAQADAQELKNAALRGELVKADEVERRWSDILRNLRARILAVPSRLRGVLDLSPGQVQRIDRELRDALAELGHGHEAKGQNGDA